MTTLRGNGLECASLVCRRSLSPTVSSSADTSESAFCSDFCKKRQFDWQHNFKQDLITALEFIRTKVKEQSKDVSKESWKSLLLCGLEVTCKLPAVMRKIDRSIEHPRKLDTMMKKLRSLKVGILPRKGQRLDSWSSRQPADVATRRPDGNEAITEMNLSTARFEQKLILLESLVEEILSTNPQSSSDTCKIQHSHNSAPLKQFSKIIKQFRIDLRLIVVASLILEHRMIQFWTASSVCPCKNAELRRENSEMLFEQISTSENKFREHVKAQFRLSSGEDVGASDRQLLDVLAAHCHTTSDWYASKAVEFLRELHKSSQEPMYTFHHKNCRSKWHQGEPFPTKHSVGDKGFKNSQPSEHSENVSKPLNNAHSGQSFLGQKISKEEEAALKADEESPNKVLVYSFPPVHKPHRDDQGRHLLTQELNRKRRGK